jgi:hypothetical protein
MSTLVISEIKKIEDVEEYEIVIFDNLYDAHPIYISSDVFKKCKIVIFNGCDKNTLYYFLNTCRFPNINTIITNTHWCYESKVKELKN